MLTRERAYEILEFSSPPPPDVLKKRYYMLALKYHPDKNNSADSKARFQEINEAYEFLTNQPTGRPTRVREGEPAAPAGSWAIYFADFFTQFFNNRIIVSIIYQLANGLFSRDTFAQLDISQMINVYSIFEKYKPIICLAEKFYKEMQEEIQKKTETLECLVLNPSIENMLDCDLYKYVYGEQVILVPLWHHELVYDIQDKGELTVKCLPKLPSGVKIDELNNLYVSVETTADAIIDNAGLKFYIGEREFIVPGEKIAFIKKQTVVLKGCGICRPVQDLTEMRRQNIYVDITIASMSWLYDGGDA